MSITQRVVLIVAVLGIALSVVAGMGAVAIVELRAATAETDERVRRVLALGQLEGSVQSVELAARDARRANSRTDAADPLADLAVAVRHLDEQLARGEFSGAPSAVVSELIARVRAFSTERASLGSRLDFSLAGSLEAQNRVIGDAARQMDDLAALFDRSRAEIRASLDAGVTTASASRWLILIGGVSVAALLAGPATALIVSHRSLVAPLRAMAAAMKRSANGDHDAVFADAHRGDEIGDLSRAAAALRDALRASAASQRRLQRDMEERTRIEETSVQDLAARLEEEVALVVRSLSSAASQLSASASGLRTSTEESDRRTGRLGRSAKETSSNVQAVASAAEELAASAQEIGSQVSQSSSISMDALKQAEGATRVVEGLSGSARKIGEVVDLIEHIASQTNLLALNATIEAARAGEAGKGFAVVAMEVKSLAEQTANATKEISSQIGAVQADVARVVEAIQSLKSSFTRANDITSSVASAIEEQSAATGAIARSVQQAAVSTQDVSSTIVDVSRAANDAGRSAAEIVEAASELTSQAETLKTRMANFISAVRKRAA